MAFLEILHRIVAGENLPAADARAAMLAFLEGEASLPRLAAFLVALKMKGETASELAGFARALREKMTRVPVDGPVCDNCGTGGDNLGTFNVSTVAALVIAGAGLPVAKHGNRSVSSNCGSADLFEALGVQLTTDPDSAARCLRETGLVYLHAPAFHPAMKQAQPVRLELRMRTVFNLVGPLANPAGAPLQVVGTGTPEAAEILAHALADLAPARALVVSGFEGLDEISICGPTLVYDVRPGEVRRHVWTPADFGLRQGSLHELQGGDREANAAIAREILAGGGGARRDIVVANAAAMLYIANAAATLKQAARLAQEAIDSGAAAQKLAALVEFSRS
jgi:anthranilate phosphoribosyltransferase